MMRKLWCLVIITLFATKGQAQMGFTKYPSEYQMKAKFLYNFARFVEWPDGVFADSNSSITIGVIDPDPFGIDLDKTVEGKRINGRGFRIRRFHRVNELEFCHILFIGTPDKEYRLQILKRLEDWSVLTVGDKKDFAYDGGIINFIMVGKKIFFEINMKALKKSGLVLSPRILKMSNLIEGD